MDFKSDYKSLKKLNIPTLKKKQKQEEKGINKLQKNISLNIYDISQEKKIHQEIVKTYKKRFGINKIKHAFKITFLFFALTLILLVFLQPSMILEITEENFVIQNKSTRTIQNINLTNLKNNTTVSYSELKPDEKIFFEKDDGFFVVTAKRQMPLFYFFGNYLNQNNNKEQTPNLKDLFEDRIS